MRPIIRPAQPEDALAVSSLAAEFAAYLRALGDTVDTCLDGAIYLRDGFGANPAFSGLVAEANGRIVGYLLYHPSYNVDDLTRTLHIIDLYVQEDCRRQGIGKSLMAEAAAVCRRLGGTQLFWSVYTPNETALAFYQRIGARYTRDLVFMRLDC